jgi:hypothetical protein
MPTKIFHFALACLSPPLGAFDPFGAFDGEGLGHELGPKEGGTDGLTNGDFVGDGLGRDDGLLVGQELGQDEGGVDRVTVGSCVGNGLGRDDGVTDGAFVEMHWASTTKMVCLQVVNSISPWKAKLMA